MTFVAFDVLQADGHDLMRSPHHARRTVLESLALNDRHCITPETFSDGPGLYQAACEQGLEGIVAKRSASLYRPRQRGWIKIKNPSYCGCGGRFAATRHSRTASTASSESLIRIDDEQRSAGQQRHERESRLSTRHLDSAVARLASRLAEYLEPLGLVLPLPPPLDQRRDASTGEPEHEHDERGRRDEQICEGHSGLDDTATQTPCR